MAATEPITITRSMRWSRTRQQTYRADGNDVRPSGVACVAVSAGFIRLERMNLTWEEAATAESAQFPGCPAGYLMDQ